MSQSIEHRVIEIIAKTLHMSPDAISLDQTIEELCPDSLDLVGLLFDLEEKFDISIPDEAKTSKTVRDIVSGIEQLICAKEEVTSA